MNDLILTGASQKYDSIAQLTVPRLAKWAIMTHNHFKYVTFDEDSSWAKIGALKRELESDQYDRVVWCDVDVVPVRYDQELIHAWDACALPAFSQDIDGLCCAVMAFSRDSKWIVDFVDQLGPVVDGKKFEQDSFKLLLSRFEIDHTILSEATVSYHTHAYDQISSSVLYHAWCDARDAKNPVELAVLAITDVIQHVDRWQADDSI